MWSERYESRTYLEQDAQPFIEQDTQPHRREIFELDALLELDGQPLERSRLSGSEVMPDDTSSTCGLENAEGGRLQADEWILSQANMSSPKQTDVKHQAQKSTDWEGRKPDMSAMPLSHLNPAENARTIDDGDDEFTVANLKMKMMMMDFTVNNPEG